jgi:hypothetical protein
MEWNGTFLNGVIVPDDPSGLVEGARVRIRLPEENHKSSPGTLGERLMALAGIAKGLPPDMAEEHNHYIHGTPRRQPKRAE